MSTVGTPAAVEVSNNEDLLREILIRVPDKAVTRFKLVSKRWFSLISDPQFVQSHVRRKPKKLPIGTFLCHTYAAKSTEIDFISFDSVPNSYETKPSLSFLDVIYESTEIEILQSCNGLLLCRVFTYQSQALSRYCVCNPTTKQYKLLPQPRETTTLKKPSGATLAFDPFVSSDYKIVLIRRVFVDRNQTCEIDIYSSGYESWRSVSYGFRLPWNIDLGRGMFSNGAIHWVGKEYSLCFDVYSEEMNQTKAYPGRAYRYVGEYGTHFHLVATDSGSESDGDILILEMSRDFTSWITKYKVSLSPFPGVTPSVLCVVVGVREEDSILVLKMPNKLVSYNFMHKKVKTLCNLPAELAEQLESVRAYPYNETLSHV